MKKHLRGRRYIRSRASVQAGRFSKQMRKLNKLARAVSALVEIMQSPNFIDGMIEAIREIEKAAKALLRREIIRRTAWRWN